MEQLLLKGVPNDRVLALHNQAIAGSPCKLQVPAPAHAKLLEASKLGPVDRQHPKESFLHKCTIPRADTQRQSALHGLQTLIAIILKHLP